MKNTEKSYNNTNQTAKNDNATDFLFERKLFEAAAKRRRNLSLRPLQNGAEAVFERNRSSKNSFLKLPPKNFYLIAEMAITLCVIAISDINIKNF